MWIPLLDLLDRANVTGEVTFAGYISIAHPSKNPVPPPPEGGARSVH
jgi:hypothetical protein